MSASMSYSFLIDRDSGVFDVLIDYTVPEYFDPETGQTYYYTSWGYDIWDFDEGSGTGEFIPSAGVSESVSISLGFPAGEAVAHLSLGFDVENDATHDGVFAYWQILNAGLAQEANTLVGANYADIVIAGAGDDLLSGLGDDDYLDAGQGNDRLEGGDGADQLVGGAGDDTMVGGAGDDTYTVDASGDAIFETADGGNDHVVASASYVLSAFVETLVLAGTAAIDGTGNAQANRIEGTASANILAGAGGGDQLYGNGGEDRLRGGEGNDLLDGGSGRDRLEGGTGDDVYVVDSGADLVVEAAGEGTDEVRVVAAAYTLGTNVEILTNIGDANGFRGRGNAAGNVLNGAGRSDSLSGLAGADTLNGGAGDDILNGGLGGDWLFGGLGEDRVSYADSVSAVTVNLATGKGARNDAAGDRLDSIEGAIGGGGDDYLLGSAAANRLEGRAGDDLLRGGAGRDWLIGGAGADTLDGGADIDGVSYGGAPGAVRVDLAGQTASGGDAQGDVLTSIDNIEGGEAGDTLIGSAAGNVLIGRDGADRLDGGAGDDILSGGLGADTLVGGSGVDRLDYAGSTGGVTIDLGQGVAAGGDAAGDFFAGIEDVRGSALGDALFGDSRNNRIEGGAGDDILRGAGGSDRLYGGTGNDIFVFRLDSERDTIADFVAGGAQDRIRVDLGDAFDSFAEVIAVASSSGGDTVFDLGPGRRLTLSGVALANLTETDFIFA